MSIKSRLAKLTGKSERGVVAKAYMKRFLPTSPVIVEAGAHIGLDTVELAKQWPGGKVFAFEPVPDIYRQLVEKTRDCLNVVCSELALGEKDGEASIFVSSGRSDGSSSLLKPKEHLAIHPDVKFEERLTIKTTTLDNWAKKEGAPNIDFLWLDLQGFELAVLKKSLQTLKTVKAIYTEVSLVENYANGPLYAELRGWLEEQGFKVQKAAIDWDDGGNVFFVRK